MSSTWRKAPKPVKFKPPKRRLHEMVYKIESELMVPGCYKRCSTGPSPYRKYNTEPFLVTEFGGQYKPRTCTLRRTFPDLDERLKLRSLPQNSEEWLNLRPYFIGASEEAKLQDLDSYGIVEHFMNFKHGIYGFHQPKKLEFEIGHGAEDLAGDCFEAVVKEAWGHKNFSKEAIGVLADMERPGRWASVDLVARGTDSVSWSFLMDWDPEWRCGWDLTDEETSSEGICFEDSIVELKSKVYDPPKEPNKIDKWMPDLLEPEQEYRMQVQSQLKTCKTQSDWPEYSRKNYAFIARLQPPFRDHNPLVDTMCVTIEGGELWWLHTWVCRYDAAYFERSIPRERHFMERYFAKDNTPFRFPEELPAPHIPGSIYLGSYAFDGPKEDWYWDLLAETTRPGRHTTAPDISMLSLNDLYRDGRYYMNQWQSYLSSA